MQHTLPVGYTLDNRYKIEKVLSQGGFGITYAAIDRRLSLSVCIKELYISGNSTRGTQHSVVFQQTRGFSFSDFVERFLEEANQLAKFKHENIVYVKDVFRANNTAYMIMEYVEGSTLQSLIEKQGAIAFDAALPMMNQLLDAVEEVHNKGMLHRDIKPENILMTQAGRLVLIDFGSAREFVEGKTQSQTAILTPGYAPIEQYSARNKRGAYTDIYAVGATFYYLLTGEKPIAATDRVAEVLKAPHEIDSKISSQVSSAIMLAMQMKTGDRFQSVGEFRAALTQLKAFGENQKTEKVNVERIEKI